MHRRILKPQSIGFALQRVKSFCVSVA